MTEYEKNFTPRTYAIIHERALCENFALLQKQAEGARVSVPAQDIEENCVLLTLGERT